MSEIIHIKTYYNEDNLPSNFSKRTDTKYARTPLWQVRENISVRKNQLFTELLEIRDILPSGTYIAGSSVMSAVAIDFGFYPEFSDIDVFCFDQQSFLDAYNALNNNFVPDRNTLKSIKNKTEKYKSLSFRYNSKNIQLLKHWWFPDAEAVIDSFDFTVCQFALDKEAIVFNLDAASRHVRDKQLHLHQHVNNYKTLVRLKRYVEKGFTPSPDLIQTLINEIKGSGPVEEEDHGEGSY